MKDIVQQNLDVMTDKINEPVEEKDSGIETAARKSVGDTVFLVSNRDKILCY